MNTFKLIVSSPDGDFYNDRAEAIYLRAHEGDLAVMAGHVPFMTSVKPCVCRIVDAEGNERSADISGGLLTVSSESAILLSSSFTWK